MAQTGLSLAVSGQKLQSEGWLADLDLQRLEVVRRVPAHQQTEGAALNLPAAVVMAKGAPEKAWPAKLGATRLCLMCSGGPVGGRR